MKFVHFLSGLMLCQMGYIQGGNTFTKSSEVRRVLKHYARYHCYQRCHSNPDDCSKDARRDLSICENLSFWVYDNNFRTCNRSCNIECMNDRICGFYVDCVPDCIRITDQKIRSSMKTPDELIRMYFNNRRSGRKYTYIE